MNSLYQRIFHRAHDRRGPSLALPQHASGGRALHHERVDESAWRPPPSADPDDRASKRTMLVPALLIQDRSIADIATITGVPPALIELIAEELSAPGPFDQLARPRTVDRVNAPSTPRSSRAPMLAIVFAGVANTATAVTSVLAHIQALGVASLVGAFWLVIAVFVFARRVRAGASTKPRMPPR